MEQDTFKTDVIFRTDTSKDFKGTVFAIFPYNVESYKGHVAYYQHVGQHSAGCYLTMISQSKPATESEYADLKKELESIGYNLNVIKKRNTEKYRVEYRKMNDKYYETVVKPLNN